MERYISLDLGLTTGYAVFDIEDNLVEWGDFAEDDYGHQLQTLVHKHTPSYSVAERPVIFRGELGDRLTEITLATGAILGTQVKWVTASAWKPTPFSRVECPEGCSVHARDAIRLGSWFGAWLKRS